jgi:hypothetical protein
MELGARSHRSTRRPRIDHWTVDGQLGSNLFGRKELLGTSANHNCCNQAITLTTRQNRTSALPFCFSSRRIQSDSSPQNPKRTHNSSDSHSSAMRLRVEVPIQEKVDVKSSRLTISRAVVRGCCECFCSHATSSPALCADKATVIRRLPKLLRPRAALAPRYSHGRHTLKQLTHSSLLHRFEAC